MKILRVYLYLDESSSLFFLRLFLATTQSTITAVFLHLCTGMTKGLLIILATDAKSFFNTTPLL